VQPPPLPYTILARNLLPSKQTNNCNIYDWNKSQPKPLLPYGQASFPLFQNMRWNIISVWSETGVVQLACQQESLTGCNNPQGVLMVGLSIKMLGLTPPRGCMGCKIFTDHHNFQTGSHCSRGCTILQTCRRHSENLTCNSVRGWWMGFSGIELSKV